MRLLPKTASITKKQDLDSGVCTYLGENPIIVWTRNWIICQAKWRICDNWVKCKFSVISVYSLWRSGYWTWGPWYLSRHKRRRTWGPISSEGINSWNVGHTNWTFIWTATTTFTNLGKPHTPGWRVFPCRRYTVLCQNALHSIITWTAVAGTWPGRGTEVVAISSRWSHCSRMVVMSWLTSLAWWGLTSTFHKWDKGNGGTRCRSPVGVPSPLLFYNIFFLTNSSEAMCSTKWSSPRPMRTDMVGMASNRLVSTQLARFSLHTTSPFCDAMIASFWQPCVLVVILYSRICLRLSR